MRTVKRYNLKKQPVGFGERKNGRKSIWWVEGMMEVEMETA